MLIVRLRNYAIKDRVAEWFMGTVIAGMGLGIFLQPAIFRLNPFFRDFLQIASPAGWALALGTVGGARIAALTINGAWRRSPHLRLASAFLSLFVWYQMSALAFQAQVPNLGIVVYPAMLLLEIYCVYFAACDAGLSDEAFKTVRE